MDHYIRSSIHLGFSDS